MPEAADRPVPKAVTSALAHAMLAAQRFIVAYDAVTARAGCSLSLMRREAMVCGM